MERELETRVDLPVVRVNRGGLYVIVAVLGIVIIASLSVTGYSLHNYAMLKRNAEELRQYNASRTNMSGLAGKRHASCWRCYHLRRSLKSLSGLAGYDTPAAGDAVDHPRHPLKSLSGLAGNHTPAAGDAVDHLRRSLRSLYGLAGNDTPAASSAVDHLLRSLKSLGTEATVPGLKPGNTGEK
ncbi:hypothetical protein MRX96_054568 [Rhipicephalus microplus]